MGMHKNTILIFRLLKQQAPDNCIQKEGPPSLWHWAQELNTAMGEQYCSSPRPNNI